MKRKLSALILFAVTLLCLCSCSKDSTFSIQFIDVGQGDSALVACDGHYMLIDGGDTSASDKVYSVLKEQGVQRLDILAVSHLHKDHYGGLIKALPALTYSPPIGITICNSNYSDKKPFSQFEHELNIMDSGITVPTDGEKYELGSATVEVIDVCADEENDSLVLLITYGKTKFLFTGDIDGDTEDSAQARIIEKYKNEADNPYKIDLIKMPHHGAKSNKLYQFLRTFMPDYVIISTGERYNNHLQDTLDLLNSKTWKPNVYRTDLNGDITVKSNGKEISVETSR